jgi:RNA polymerase sigma factor (sigma-70 family)
MLRERSFDELYSTLYPVLFRIAYRITGSEQKAEDLCHEAFIRYVQREEPLPDLDQTKYWLIRVLRNIALNHEKRRTRERQAYERLHRMEPGFSDGSDQEFFREQARSEVQGALNRLPPRLRMVLVLKEYGDMGYRDIAKTLGTTEGNVKVMAFRARERLLKLLEGQERGP